MLPIEIRDLLPQDLAKPITVEQAAAIHAYCMAQCQDPLDVSLIIPRNAGAAARGIDRQSHVNAGVGILRTSEIHLKYAPETKRLRLSVFQDEYDHDPQQSFVCTEHHIHEKGASGQGPFLRTHGYYIDIRTHQRVLRMEETTAPRRLSYLDRHHLPTARSRLREEMVAVLHQSLKGRVEGATVANKIRFARVKLLSLFINTAQIPGWQYPVIADVCQRRYSDRYLEFVDFLGHPVHLEWDAAAQLDHLRRWLALLDITVTQEGQYSQMLEPQLRSMIQSLAVVDDDGEPLNVGAWSAL
jgi:hypothetical protein